MTRENNLKKLCFKKKLVSIAKSTGFKTGAIFIATVIFLLQVYASFQINGVLEALDHSPDIVLEISPFLHEERFGEFLPLVATNTGDYTLEDVHILVSTCQMLDSGKFEHYSLPVLPANSERVIPFGNRETISDFKRANCYPFAGSERTYASFPINYSKIVKEKNYTVSSVGCGLCFFNATIFASYHEGGQTKEFNKSIRSHFNSPVTLTASISGEVK